MYFWKLYQYSMHRLEYSSSFSTFISMKLDQKREKHQSGLISAKLKPESHQGYLQSQVRHYCKTLEIFMTCPLFFISNGKFDIICQGYA